MRLLLKQPLSTEMAKLVFDKLCTRKSVRDKYLYTEVIYNYEFLEDYQDIYSDFQEISTERLPQPEQHSDIYGGTESEEDITPPQWGPEHYKYRTHPLYLMVSRSCASISTVYFQIQSVRIIFCRIQLPSTTMQHPFCIDPASFYTLSFKP